LPALSAPRTTRIAGLLLVFIASLVLAGWILGIEDLKGLFGRITMKANAAAGLLAAGVALVFVRTSHKGALTAGRCCAAFVGLLGAATLSEHVAGWNLGIDELLFTEAPGALATASPGRMGVNASLCFVLSGIALAGLHRKTRRGVVVAQVLGAIVMTLALIPMTGYIYGATELYAIGRFTGIAFHTAVALLVLGLGLIAARPSAGPVAALLTEAPHGIMARRLLVVAVSVPLVLGYFRVLGERRGWYDVSLGASMFAVAMIVLLSLTIWRTAVALGRTGKDLERAEQARNDLLMLERTARQKAEQADRAKDEFIAALSHELRTPLNAILGWMYMVRNEAVPDAAKGKAAEAVVRNAGLLARLIEDLLDTSRISTGRLELAIGPVDVREVVHAAIESVLPASQQRGVVVALDDGPTVPKVSGDSQRLQQVVWNLLSNAIKFSAPGETVNVGISAREGVVLVGVRDHGVGIDAAFLPQLFERFQQADSSTARESGGLGLGLYIARHLTEMHGGSLQARSDGRGKGAEFTLSLPTGGGHATPPGH
jgi:signal transduction histidine kinase